MAVPLCLFMLRAPHTVPMNALERLKAACSMKPIHHSVDLPNGEELEYWATPLTIAERTKARKMAKSEDPTDFALQLLVMKAKDEAGVPMFGIEAIPQLRNFLPAKVVEALMLQLLDEGEGEEEVDYDPKPSSAKSKKTAS